jgi:hypothetical protein
MYPAGTNFYPAGITIASRRDIFLSRRDNEPLLQLSFHAKRGNEKESFPL